MGYHTNRLGVPLERPCIFLEYHVSSSKQGRLKLVGTDRRRLMTGKPVSDALAHGERYEAFVVTYKQAGDSVHVIQDTIAEHKPDTTWLGISVLHGSSKRIITTDIPLKCVALSQSGGEGMMEVSDSADMVASWVTMWMDMI